MKTRTGWSAGYFVVGVLVCAIARASEVPPEFRALYAEMEANLQDFDRTLDNARNHEKAETLFGAELIPADAHARIADAGYYERAVTPYLNGLESLGAKVVKFQLGFPLLYRLYYRDHLGSDGEALFERRLAFYQRLMGDLRKRGIKVIAQAVITPAAGGDYVGDPLKLSSYYRSLSLNQYIVGRAENIVTIARELKPDYINIEAEPDTEGPKALRPELADAAVNFRMVKNILDELEAANIPGLHRTIQVAAGMGTWQRELPDYVKNYTSLAGIDVIDIHIHPVNKTDRFDLLRNALTIADAAHAAGKKVGADEEWLRKMSVQDFRKPPVDTAVREHWNFWAPLDQMFLRVLVKFAHHERLEYVCVSGSQLFRYLEYVPAKSTAEWAAEAARGLGESLRQNPPLLSETGVAYRDLIAK